MIHTCFNNLAIQPFNRFKVYEWIAKDWFPRAIKAGLKNIAYIYPPDVFGQFAIQDLIKKTPHYTSQVFKEMTDAKAWIKSLV